MNIKAHRSCIPIGRPEVLCLFYCVVMLLIVIYVYFLRFVFCVVMFFPRILGPTSSIGRPEVHGPQRALRDLRADLDAALLLAET